MAKALYLNGVFESVLQEILVAQKKKKNLICYLQPYDSSRIRLLATSQPSLENPIQLYISTSHELSRVSYRGQIVGWEDKQKLGNGRLAQLNQHIKDFQEKEEKIYLEVKGKPCVNLISVLNLERLDYPFPVSNLIKFSDNKPHQTRTQPGRWSEVKLVPQWRGTQEPILKEQLDSELEQGKKDSEHLSESERRRRLESAPKLPEKVQVVSLQYRRNPDVIVEVLKNANGICQGCQKEAPFVRAKDGTPYLEVHHLVTLSEGGEDTVENAVALCPNCHRKAHYGY